MRFTLQSTEPVTRVIDPAVTKNLLRSIHAVFNGVFAMSQDVPGLVETSSNLASVKRVKDNVLMVTTSQRSSIESARDNVSDSVRTAFELTHKDDIIAGAMQFTAKTVEKKIADKIAANGARPTENGLNSQSASLTKSDVSQLSKAEILNLQKRIAQGEKISFG
jgi:di/tripeptidase